MEEQKLRRMLDNADARERLRAAFLLGKKRLPASKTVLKSLLSDPVELVRRAAIRAISRLRGETVHLLVELLCDGDSIAVMKEAVRAAASSGNPKVLENVAKLSPHLSGSVKAVLIDELYRSGWRRTDLLIEALSDKSPLVRTAAVQRARVFGTGDVLVSVRECVYDSCTDVRAAAIFTLAELGVGGSTELLMAATRDGHPQVRVAACRALGMLKDDSCLGALTGCLEDARPEVRSAAVETLGKLASDECCQYLRKALFDQDEDVRNLSAAALEKNGFHTPESLVALGDRVLGLGDEERAVELWHRAIDESHFCTDAYVRLGKYWLRKRELDEARSCFSRVCEINPGERNGLLGLARCEHRADNHEIAERSLHQILESRPDDVEVHQLMGEINLSMGNLSQSLYHFRTCRGMLPEDPRVLAGLGRVYLKKRAWRQALVFLRKSVAIDETTPIWRELGDALLRLGQKSQAIECFWRALDLNPDDRPSLMRLSQLAGSGYPNIDRIERALSSSLDRSGDPILAFLLAKSLAGRDCLKEAIAVLQNRAGEGKCPSFIYYNLGRLHYKNRNMDESLKNCEIALKHDETLVPARKLLARILVSRQKLSEAVSILKPVVRLHPENLDFLEKTAVLAESAGDRELAIWCLERVITGQPGRTDLRMNLARILMVGEKYDEAVYHLEKALREQPENRASRLEMATCLKALGRYSEASDIISVGFNPANIEDRLGREASLLLSDLLEREGRLEESTSILARAEEVFPDDNEVLARRGALLLAQEEWSKAQTVFNRLLDSKPDAFEGHWGLARTLIVQGEKEEALQHFLRAAHLKPDEPSSWFEAGEIARETGDLDTAKHYLSRAFALGMESPLLLVGFGEVKEVEGAFQEALSLYRKALRIAPERGRAYLGMGRVLCKLDRCVEALDILLKGLKRTMDEVSRGAMAREAGRILVGLGRRSEAAFYLRDAVSRNDLDGLAHYELGVVCLEDDMVDEARRHLEAACSSLPDDARPRSLLAGILFSCGQLKAAADRYREAFQLDPGDTELLLRLGIVFKALGRFRESGMYLDRALVARPEDPEVHLERGYYFLTRSLLNEARESLEKALSLDPDLDEARFRLGEVCFELHRPEDVLSNLEALIIRIPDHIAAHRLLGMFFENNNDFDRAVVHFRQVLLLSKDDLISSLSLGRLSFLKGSYREALVHLERAFSSCPSSPEVLTWLGRTRLVLQSVDQAIETLQKALELQPESKSASFWLARALQLGGYPDKAIPLFENLLETPVYACEASLALGRVFVQKGLTPEAGKHFERALQMRPFDPEALYQLGRMALVRNEMKKAENLLTKAREAGCGEPDLPELLSEVLEKTERWDEARRLCLEIIKVDQCCRGVLMRLATIEEKTGYPARALAFFSRLLELEPQNGLLMLRTARLLLAMERWEESFAMLRRAAVQVPENADLWRLFSAVYERTGNMEGLEETSRRLLNLEPTETPARELLTRLLFEKGKDEQALDVVRPGLSWDKDGRLWRMVALIEGNRKDYRSAAKAWIKACRRTPGNHTWRLELAESLLQCSKFISARRLAESIYKNGQETSRASFLTGRALVAEGDRSSAAPWFRRAAEAEYKPGLCYLELGRCFLAQKSYPEAHGILSRAVELRAQDPEARYALAETAALIGRTTEALAHLEDLLAIKPDRWDALLLKGRLLWQEGRLDAAGKTFMYAVRSDPENPRVVGPAAQFLLKVGCFKQALELYRSLSRLSDDVKTRLGRAQASLALGGVSEALAVMEGITFGKTHDDEVLFLRGLTKYQAGETKQAVESLEHVVRLTTPGSRTWEGATRLLAKIYEDAALWTKVLAVREEMMANGVAVPYDILKSGESAFQAGKIERSRWLYNRYISLRGETPEVMIGLSRICRREKNLEDALGYLRRSLAFRPYDTALAREMVMVFKESGRVVEARDLLESLVQRFPDDLAVRIELGRFCLEQGDQPAALIHFSRASLSDQAPVDIHRHIGIIRFKQGDNAGAEKAFVRLLREVPDDDDATCLLADVLVGEGEAIRAFKLLRNYVSKKPGSLQASLRLANICREKKRFAAAKGILRVILEDFPDSADVHLSLGQMAMEQNDQDIALDHLQRACSLRPGHILTLRLIGQVYRDIGLTDAALDTYRKIIESVQDDPGLLFDYASLLAESNRSGEAIAVYQRLIRSNPENVEALYNLGLVYNSEGLLDKAVECYRHVVARAVPGSPVHRLASEMVRPRRVSIEMAK